MRVLTRAWLGAVAEPANPRAWTVSSESAGADDVADCRRGCRLAPDAESKLRGHQRHAQTAWRQHRKFDVDCLAAAGVSRGDCRRCLAMDAVCLSGSAGRVAGDSPGTVRSGADRRIQPVANISTRDSAIAEARDSDRVAVAHDGSAACV